MSATKPTVLVTGSSGLIGRATVERLARGYTVVGFDVQEPAPGAPLVFGKVDMTSDQSVSTGLRRLRKRLGDRLAAVVHLAGHCDLLGGPSPLYSEVNVGGTMRLIRGLHEFQTAQFIFASTMLVHAPCEPGERITEQSPISPKWEYPEFMLRAEKLILAERDDTPAVLLRVAGVYDGWCHSPPLARQIQGIYERHLTSHVYPADPARGQAYVHVEDVAAAIEHAVERRVQLPPESVVLIGEPETLGYGELQDRFAKLIHHEEWDTYRVPKPLAKVGAWVKGHLPFAGEPLLKPRMIDRVDDHYELDISRARRLLGWKPKHALGDTLGDMVAALKADPIIWYGDNKLEEAAQPAGSHED